MDTLPAGAGTHCTGAHRGNWSVYHEPLRLTRRGAADVGAESDDGPGMEDGGSDAVDAGPEDANPDYGALRQPDADTAVRGRGERTVRPMEPNPDPHAKGGATESDRLSLFGDDGAVLPEGGG